MLVAKFGDTPWVLPQEKKKQKQAQSTQESFHNIFPLG